MQPTIAERIAHIDKAIDDIREALAKQTKAGFTDNPMLRLAVERLLEIISEASRHIPLEMRAKEPNINWRRLADLGFDMLTTGRIQASCGIWSRMI